MWLYGSGFPKSMNIGLAIDKKNGVEVKSSYVANEKNNVYGNKMGGGKTDKNLKAQNEWAGWGTALKPSFEPIIVARKPFKGSLVDNVIEWGVGGINIDECRVGSEIIKGGTMPDFRDIGEKSKASIGIDKLSFGQVENAKRKPLDDHIGRFPANTILTYDQITFDEVCGGFPYTKSTGGKGEKSKINTFSNTYNGGWGHEQNCSHLGGLGDEGSASRYFYCAKASKKDRDEGLDNFEDNYMAFSNQAKAELKRGNVDFKGNEDNPMNFVNSVSVRKNIHPTVKPTELMQYLVRLVTPNGGTILDPFMGSGSTGKAAAYENKERNKDYKFIGIEQNKEYCEIAKARINYVVEKRGK